MVDRWCVNYIYLFACGSPYGHGTGDIFLHKFSQNLPSWLVSPFSSIPELPNKWRWRKELRKDNGETKEMCLTKEK